MYRDEGKMFPIHWGVNFYISRSIMNFCCCSFHHVSHFFIVGGKISPYVEATGMFVLVGRFFKFLVKRGILRFSPPWMAHYLWGRYAAAWRVKKRRSKYFRGDKINFQILSICLGDISDEDSNDSRIFGDNVEQKAQLHEMDFAGCPDDRRHFCTGNSYVKFLNCKWVYWTKLRKHFS